MISQNAGGVDYVPGIYTDAQVDAWKQVCCIELTECELTEYPKPQITDAVHEKGSFIYLQLCALGRNAEPAFSPKRTILTSQLHPFPSPEGKTELYHAHSP